MYFLMSYYWKWISRSLFAKIKCKTNGVSGDNSKWNLCFRGPKVRVNGSLWSLGNLIQEAGLITSVLTGRQPVPFLFPPFLLSLLLVLSPHFNFFFFSVMFFLLSCFHSFVLWLLWDIISSLFFLHPFLLADGVISIVPLFFGIQWKHTRVHVTTHIHEHSVFVSVSLHLFPSLSSSVFLSVPLSPVTERRGHGLSVMKECKLDEYDGFVLFPALFVSSLFLNQSLVS